MVLVQWMFMVHMPGVVTRCYALLRLKHFCLHFGCRMEVISGPFLGGGPTVAFSVME